MSAVLYSLVIAVVLLLVGTVLLWSLVGGATGTAVAAGCALCVLLAVAHRVLLSVLRRADVHRPGVASTLLTGSVVLMFAQTAFMVLVHDVSTFMSVPVAAAALGGAVAAVLAVNRRRAFGWACVAVCAFLLLQSLFSLGLEAVDDRQETRRVRAAVADYPYEVAVLDAPGWTPVSVNTHHGDERMIVVYENADGEGVVLTTWGDYVPPHDQDRPLWARCEGYAVECAEPSEGIVLREGDPGVREPDEARLEVLPGRVAVLEQREEQIPGSLHGHTLPDIGLDELHGLAAHVRVAEDGELVEIVERTG
ncbi:hypothetical protein [Nocardiopsis synnemataformans]|uniref:hypothetical protein n=1 Tax=Nocardiopsis synnemataformans TaxID=61305 RepID=UPI003EBD7B7A